MRTNMTLTPDAINLDFFTQIISFLLNDQWPQCKQEPEVIRSIVPRGPDFRPKENDRPRGATLKCRIW